MLDLSRAQLHKLVQKEHAALCLSMLRCLRDSTTPPAGISPLSSKQISVLRTHVAELSLLVLRQADINGRFIAVSVCLPTAKAVDSARNDAHSCKTEADRVPGNEVRSVRCDESECRNDSTNVAETNLDHISTSHAAVSRRRAPRTCHAVPTARLWWPPRFMLYQHTITGIAEYVPIVTMKSAPYCKSKLLWTEIRIPNPAIAMQIQKIA